MLQLSILLSCVVLNRPPSRLATIPASPYLAPFLPAHPSVEEAKTVRAACPNLVTVRVGITCASFEEAEEALDLFPGRQMIELGRPRFAPPNQQFASDDNERTCGQIRRLVADPRVAGLIFDHSWGLREASRYRALGQGLAEAGRNGSPGLEELRLIWCQLNNEDGLAIAKGIRMNSSLTALEITQSQLESQGCAEIETALGATAAQLRLLNLITMDHSDDRPLGVALMLKPGSLLSELNLTSCCLTAAGIPALAQALAACSTLVTLLLDQNECASQPLTQPAAARSSPLTRTALSVQTQTPVCGCIGADCAASAVSKPAPAGSCSETQAATTANATQRPSCARSQPVPSSASPSCR